MKKIFCVIISFLLLLALTSCEIGNIIVRFEDAILENANVNINVSNSEGSVEAENTETPKTKDKEPSETKEANGDRSNSDDPDDNSNTNNNSDTENKNNGKVLKETSSESMLLPVNVRQLGTTNVSEENNAETVTATVVQYILDGNVVNWTTENDIIYVITEGNNRLVVIDSKNMNALYNTPLTGVPAEMNIVDDKIYISLPDLCRIDVFSKSNCKKETALYFDTAVSSFCLDGDYIYYSEHDQHCKVYKKNLVTNEKTEIRTSNIYSFYEPKVYLNKEDRILYIGERGTTGSSIYYFDSDTLELKSVFEKDDYGIFNHTREIFHIGDMIFWGNYCLSDTNAKQLIARYGTADYGSVVFASEELVATYEGIFLTDTCECIVNYDDANFKFEYVLVSNSYHVFFRMRSYSDGNFMIGVNFNLQ